MSKHYFFDSSFISEEKNTVLKLSEPQKTFTSAAWADPLQITSRTDIPDWECRISILYPYVNYDENGISVDGIHRAKYKIWYESWYESDLSAFTKRGRKWLDFIIDKNNSQSVDIGDFHNTAKGVVSAVYPNFYCAVCYMESNDGIHWHRPDCGEFFYKQEDGEIVGTNIVFIGESGPGIVKNTHPLAGKSEPAYLFACGHDGVLISASMDGIHWELPTKVYGEFESRVQVRCDTQNHIVWSPEASRYVIITRGIEFDKRDVLRTVVVLVGPERLCPCGGSNTDLSFAKGSFSYPFVALSGPLGAQPYSMPIYRLCDGYYLGIVSIFDYDQTKEEPYRVYAALAWSRDCINWKYLANGQPFIPNAPELKMEKGNDFGMIYCASPIEADGKIKIFYAAIPEAHYVEYDQIPLAWRAVIDEAIPRAKSEKRPTRTTALNMATVDIDRFAGLFSEDGKIVTKPMPSVEGEAYISADVYSGGEIKVRCLDESGKVISGFDYDAFAPITESLTNARLVCNHDISALKNRSIALEMTVKNATVYACEIR